MQNRLNQFIEMVKNNHFVDAHQILEHDWKELKKRVPNEAKILKGFINGATAFALKNRGKDSGANRVWTTYKKYEPLIDEVDSIYKDLYKEMQKLILIKYNQIMRGD